MHIPVVPLELITFQCKKGDAIANFLEICHQQLSELRGISVDNLMYIGLKEDLMIPHHYIFYDFIVNKARGNSGLLFNFDVDDDDRLLSDAMMEKDESHAGKVVERGWYKRLTKRRRPRVLFKSHLCRFSTRFHCAFSISRALHQ